MTRIALPYLTVATVRGTDAAAFLHAQLSADIENLAPGEATFACYCSPRGQVYGLLLVLSEQDAFRVVAAADLMPSIVRRLQLFVLRAQVEIAVKSECSVFGVPDAASAGESEPGIVRPLPNGPAYQLAAAEAHSGASVAAWKAQELSQGVAWLGAATSERFIPQMLGFDSLGAVSFRKGCYPGQEIIARARYLGQVKRRPLCLQVTGSPDVPPGTAVDVMTGSEWQTATVIDSVAMVAEAAAGDDPATILFLVAPVTEAPVEALRQADRDYRCATI